MFEKQCIPVSYTHLLVKSLLSYYPQYTWQLLLRLGKTDVVKKSITREYLRSENREEIDELFEYVYNAIMNNIGNFQKYDPWYDCFDTELLVLFLC